MKRTNFLDPSLMDIKPARTGGFAWAVAAGDAARGRGVATSGRASTEDLARDCAITALRRLFEPKVL